MAETNHGTALLSLTADHETLKAHIAGWSDAERQAAIDWAVARLVGGGEPEVPAHVAPFLAAAGEDVRLHGAVTLCLAASQKAAIHSGLPRKTYANLVLKLGGTNLAAALSEGKTVTTGAPTGATKH